MRKLSVLFTVLFALFITAPAFAADVYLRGDLAGGWSDQSDWKFTDEGNSIYTLEKASVTEGKEFKIYDYNAGSGDAGYITIKAGDVKVPEGWKDYLTGDNNLQFQHSLTNVKFTYNANSKTLAIDSTTGGETPTPTPTTPWTDYLCIKGNWAGGDWICSKFDYDADSDSWKATIDVAKATFSFGLCNSTDGLNEGKPWFGVNGHPFTPDAAKEITFSGDNGSASGFTTGVTYTVVLRLTGEKAATLEFVSPVIEPETFWLSGETIGWFHKGGGKQFTEQPNGTFTLELGDVAKGSQFKFRGSKSSNYWTLQDVTGSKPAEVSFVTEGLEYGAAQFDADFTDVVFTYTPGAEKSISITGNPILPLADIYLQNNQNWSDMTPAGWKLESTDDGITYTLNKASVPANFEFLIKVNGTSETNQDFTVSGNCGVTAKSGTNNYVFPGEEYKNVTFTYNPSTKVLDIKGRRASDDPSVGDYGFGSRLFITFRNDADTTHPWETHEIVFEAYSDETPNALNQFVYRFRANAMNIPFYLHNDAVENDDRTLSPAGTIYASTGNFEVGHLDKYLFETETLEGKWNLFKDLTLGEDYRIIVKAPKGDKKNETYLGIFPVLADMPWGVDPEGLRLHSNFTGAWSEIDKTGVNITKGPALQYNEATGIWYVDFKLGNPSGFSTNLVNGNFVSSTDKGYEFTFTDNNGINWYKSPIELPLDQWTNGAMKLLTNDNDLNFFVKKTDALKVDSSYRLQLRKNEVTGEWQMRLTETPLEEKDPTLYIRSTDNKVGTTVMPKAFDVNGDEIPGYYIYTMPYNGGSFEVSTSKDNFDDNRLCGATNQAPIELRTPYDFYEHVGGKPEWTASDSNLGMISVVVNYNTKTLRIYSPSVNMALTSRHVERIPGNFDGEKFGVPESDLKNHVEGATDEHPVTFERVNSINIQLDLTNLFFDRECEFVIDGLTVNGSEVDNIAGRKINWADEVTTAIKNHIYHLPYSGHLSVDGQFATTQPEYTFVLTYTISKGELSKKGTTELKYTPNFQPYFVRPRPVADSDNAYTGSLRVQNAWLGNGNWAAVATRKVQFAGNTGEIDEATGKPILYCYNGADYDKNGELGDPDLSKARIGVYPGFKVTVEGVTPEMQKHHVPACRTHYGKFGEGFFLANYTGHNGESTIDWSSAALLEGYLPVVVSLDHTAGTSGWLQGINGGPTGSDSRLTYEIYAHYPLYVYKGGVCADSFEEAEEVIVKNLATSTPAVKAPVKRVFHNSTDDENSVCTERNHIGVHSIVARRKFNGMTELVQSTTGIEGVEIETEAEAGQAAPEYYNLQGIRVANPAPGNVYILRQGNTTTKVRL